MTNELYPQGVDEQKNTNKLDTKNEMIFSLFQNLK